MTLSAVLNAQCPSEVFMAPGHRVSNCQRVSYCDHIVKITGERTSTVK